MWWICLCTKDRAVMGGACKQLRGNLLIVHSVHLIRVAAYATSGGSCKNEPQRRMIQKLFLTRSPTYKVPTTTKAWRPSRGPGAVQKQAHGPALPRQNAGHNK